MSRYDDVLQNYLFFNQYNEWQKVKIKQIKLIQITIYVDIQSIIYNTVFNNKLTRLQKPVK